MPRVSIITPVFNSARYLPESVASVLAQTCEDWELLLADDGSNDGSFELCREFAARHPGRIIALHHPERRNHRVAATRNLALAHATGEYIALLDQDDVWLPHKLERQLRAVAEQPDAGLIFAQALCVDEHSRPITEPCTSYELHGVIGWGWRASLAEAYDCFLRSAWYAPSATVLARADLLRGLGGFPTKLTHPCDDTISWIRIARRAPVVFLPETLACYRLHSGSWTGQVARSTLFEVERETLDRLARSDGIDGPLARAYLRTMHALWTAREVPLATRLGRVLKVARAARGHPRLPLEAARLGARAARKRFNRSRIHAAETKRA